MVAAPACTQLQIDAAAARHPPVPATCVVTGGSGFVGQRLVEMLVERGAKRVVSFDIVPHPPNKWDHPAIEYVTGDLRDAAAYRDLAKPMGALDDERLAEVLQRYASFTDTDIPKFMYGSHYSTAAGVVLHYLVRLHPFAGLHCALQNGHFDVADRLFASVPAAWAACAERGAVEVKELTPEWYSNADFLRNRSRLALGIVSRV